MDVQSDAMSGEGFSQYMAEFNIQSSMPSIPFHRPASTESSTIVNPVLERKRNDTARYLFVDNDEDIVQANEIFGVHSFTLVADFVREQSTGSAKTPLMPSKRRPGVFFRKPYDVILNSPLYFANGKTVTRSTNIPAPTAAALLLLVNTFRNMNARVLLMQT